MPLSATTDRYPLLTGGGDMMTTMELASPSESRRNGTPGTLIVSGFLNWNAQVLAMVKWLA